MAVSEGSTQPDDKLYFNGIDAETGEYALKPASLDDLAKAARGAPQLDAIRALRGEGAMKSFGLPPGIDYKTLSSAGWGVIYHENASDEVKEALAPLIDRRRREAGTRFKTLDYKTGEQTRDWYRRRELRTGSIDPEVVPYFLLIVGGPDEIPFEFQYLLGIDYAVGRLALATPGEYARYAQSIVAYETADAIRRAKKIAYWGTRHVGDGATQLSSSLLVTPLANGAANLSGRLQRPLAGEFGFQQQLFLGDDATKEKLIGVFGGEKPPAILFTASHGMETNSGRPNQQAVQGALLCQEWPGFGMMRPDYYLAASDVPDDADVNGLVAFFFACFGAGTPKADPFITDPADLGKTLPDHAPQPFMAALPRRLLAHPKGSALAVVAHVDRAWGCSIQAPGTTGAQIGAFRDSLGYVMLGDPVGHAVRDQFGGQFAALSAQLASSLMPGSAPLSDVDLVTYWLERNDAQNYVTLGDPAVRLRLDKFA